MTVPNGFHPIPGSEWTYGYRARFANAIVVHVIRHGAGEWSAYVQVAGLATKWLAQLVPFGRAMGAAARYVRTHDDLVPFGRYVNGGS